MSEDRGSGDSYSSVCAFLSSTVRKGPWGGEGRGGNKRREAAAGKVFLSDAAPWEERRGEARHTRYPYPGLRMSDR